jgi:hypothetical protein
MIIGNLPGTPFGSRANSASQNATGATARPAAQPASDSPTVSPDGPATPRIVFTAEPVQTSGAPSDEDTVSPQQTARIVALVASMSRTDDISAYAMLGRGEQADTDEYRQVVSAYKNF